LFRNIPIDELQEFAQKNENEFKNKTSNNKNKTLIFIVYVICRKGITSKNAVEILLSLHF